MRKITVILLIPILFVIGSCSTEFDINADWKDIAIVYGLLNQNDDAHYIRLTKAFLGEENAYDMAQISDSLYYESAKVFLIPMLNGDEIQVFPDTFLAIKMIPTTDIEKDTGIFATDNNLLYYTDEDLNHIEYKLQIDIPGKNSITSSTKLIDELSVKAPTVNQKIPFSDQDHYRDFKAKIVANPNGYLYGLTIRFHYTQTLNNYTTHHYLDWVRPNIKRSFIEGGTSAVNEVTWNLSGEEFYWFLGNNIDKTNPAIVRKFTGLDFMFYSGNEDLSLYADINGPSQGVVQEKPPFTNMDDPGIAIGLFASRFNKIVEDKVLNDWSLDRLSCSKYTEHLRFANSVGAWDQCD